MADYVLDMLLHGVFVDPLSAILAMRQQRFHTVHTKIQLLFLYNYLTCNALHERNQLLVPCDPGPARAPSSAREHPET